MLLDFGVVTNAILLVLGLLWCHGMLGRWRGDLAEFRSSSDPTERTAILLPWAATIVIVPLLANFLLGMAGRLGLV